MAKLWKILQTEPLFSEIGLKSYLCGDDVLALARYRRRLVDHFKLVLIQIYGSNLLPDKLLQIKRHKQEERSMEFNVFQKEIEFVFIYL